ncbi:MAG: WxL domain-containing protein [Vagococcus sp.]|uniref:WxL domain-containing protein n=1 Tax=Vagococcus sp. TaxID=1933889 RepID=UPI002FCCAA4C
MKRLITSSLLVLLSFSLGVNVLAEISGSKNLIPKGKVSVKDSGKTEIVDPENPGEIINPDPGPSTNGSLRIDYVSSLDFGKVVISKKNRNFNALATQIGKKNQNRGLFIQISDFREKNSGWALQVKQNEQFNTKNYDELSGSVLSFDKGWINSLNDKKLPEVTRDTLSINNIGEVYDVARASSETGSGVWTVNFGASKENDNNQPITINEDTKTGTRNSAVSLSVPISTKVLPKEYETKITWILAETP